MSTTVAPPLVNKLADDWETKCGLRSARCSGIIGDAAHQARGGYHVGRRFQPGDNYSVVRPDDLLGPDDAAAAIDMTLGDQDMRVCTARLVACFSNLQDPRRKYINAFNGTTDSTNARRWDVYARKVKSATKDHLWHIHLEIRRKYVGSAVAMAAILSVLKGESVKDYLSWAAPSSPAASLKSSSTVTASTLSAAVPAFPGLLRRNDQQKVALPAVRQFQAQLIKRGWTSIGAADGFFGPKMEAGVKGWQKRCGLVADGVIGARTWPTPWTAG